jgi:hypothetical protein
MNVRRFRTYIERFPVLRGWFTSEPLTSIVIYTNLSGESVGYMEVARTTGIRRYRSYAITKSSWARIERLRQQMI